VLRKRAARYLDERLWDRGGHRKEARGQATGKNRDG
jgi:hypothetical protein